MRLVVSLKQAGGAFAGGRPSGRIRLALLCVVALAAFLAPAAQALAAEVPLTTETEGNGSGTIECKVGAGPVGACAVEYPEGTEIAFVAKPSAGSEFFEWGGDCLGQAEECELTLEEPTTVTAVFELEEFTLETTVEGSGEGEIECEVELTPVEPCEGEYPFGTEVTLRGEPAAGSEFVEWEGCEFEIENECEVTIEESKSVTAVFALIEFTLEVETEGNGSGTVTSEPAGINCGSECAAEYLEGEEVILTAEPEAGSEFVEWIGCEEELSATECEVTMSEGKEVTAVFALIEFTLEVEKEGSGSGTVTSSPPGINCGATCSAEYLEGEEVTLSASPSAGSEFVEWEGCDAEPTAEECEVTMNEAREVTAVFALIEFTLEVEKEGTGSGTVTSSPAGINCGTTCSAEFVEGEAVVLTASPNAGSEFVEWIGCEEELSATECEVTMSEGKEVTAVFALEPTPTFTLEVEVKGSGSGTVSAPEDINCPGVCAGVYNEGETVTLTAEAGIGSEFAGWEGCDTEPSANKCEVTMEEDRTVTATFEPEPPSEFALTVVPAGTGKGTVTSSPAGINCGIDCSEAYAAGTEVTLTAAAASGSTFAGWSGSCTGSGSCKVTMSQARSVTATFTKESTPPPPPGPGIASVAPTAKVKSGKALLKLTCAGEGPCKGSLKLTAKIKSGGKTRNLTIGKGSFNLAAGAKTTLKVKLSGPAKKAVAKKPLKAKVKGSGVRSSTVKLKK